MKFSIGVFSPSVVNVTNKQGYVEYEFLSGFDSEDYVRSYVGNCGRSEYGPHYSGYWKDRVVAINTLENAIKSKKEELEKLEFALKVTKKKVWKLKE